MPLIDDILSDNGENIDYSLNIRYHKDKQFQSFDFTPQKDVTKEQIQAVDSRMDIVKESAKEHDTLYGRMKHITKSAARASSWLVTRIMPKEKALDDEMNTAAGNLGISSLSSSQRSKRGKKFADKARLQAKMVNLANKCRWQRAEALEDLMEHGKQSRLGKDFIVTAVKDFEGDIFREGTIIDKSSDTYLKDLGKDIDDFSPMLRDLSFYYERKARDEKYDKKNGKPFRYDIIEKVADPKKRKEGYREVIRDFDRLDLSKFNYKDNDEFSDNEKHSFEIRYAELRAFSHVGEMLKSLEDTTDDLTLKKNMKVYRAKAETLKEILEDYENRMIMLQSPYYVLLAGKDVGSFSDKEIMERIGKTDDPLVKIYLDRVLEKRQHKDAFGRGKKAEKIFEKKLKQLKSGKNEQWEPTLDEYVSQNAQMFYFRADTYVVCKYPPFLYDKKQDRAELEKKADEIKMLHRELMASGNLYGTRPKSTPEFLYVYIDEEQYKSFVRHQQELENVGSKVRLLEEMRKNAVGARGDEIDDLIEKLTGSASFKQIQNDFLTEAEELKTKLATWRSNHQG